MKKFKIKTEDLDLEVFDEAQRDVVLRLVQGAVDQVAESDEENQDEFHDMPAEHVRLLAQDAQKVAKMTRLWKSNGRVKGLKEQVTLDELIKHSNSWGQKFATEAQDAGFTSTDHPMLIERTIAEVVKEAVEPNIVLTGLLQTINFSHGTQLTFPAMGAFTAADIPEGGEYPERSLDFAGQVVATIGKSGVAVKMTEEMLRYSLFDVMSMHLRAAGRSLIRWKEQKVADMIIDNAGGANTLFNNESTAFSSTTGRDGAGAYNGTLTLDDLFNAYSSMIDRGFTPNTLLMNPFGWRIFADEGVARAFGFINGLAMWQQLQGSPAALPQFNGPEALLTQQQPSGPENIATTFTNVPSQFPAPFNIVVTPYLPYQAATTSTDIIMCDRSELGILVVDETVTTDEWDDPARDIRKVKLRERYGLASMNNGAGTGIMKHISTARSFDFSRNLTHDVTPVHGLSGDAGNMAIVGD